MTVLRVAMVGYAFMGAAHSQAWRAAPRVFDLPIAPEMTLLIGRNPDRVAAAAEQMGWVSTDTDWRRAVERDDIDLIDICTLRPVGIGAAQRRRREGLTWLASKS
jgi:predicted dehydrogenase